MKKKKTAMLCVMIMAAVVSLTACSQTDSSAGEAEMLTGEPLLPAEESESSEVTETVGESASSGMTEAAKESEISGTEKTDAPSVGNSVQSSAGSLGTEEDKANGSAAGENSFQSVLRGENSFICTDLAGKSINIEEIGWAVTDDDSVTVSAEKFAVIDLDDDGEEEIVLWLQINKISDYGFEVLHVQDGEIYGYTLSYREFMNLKTDGTFMFSGGAADSGIGKMVFSGVEYSINKQVYSSSEYDAENELTVQYFANEGSCSADEFDEAMDSQEQKADVKWYDLSEENIDTAFR